MVIEIGPTVQIAYEATLLDGTLIGKNKDKIPLEFTVGKNQVIKGIENTVIGIKEGEKKEVNIEHKNAFGNIKTSLIKEIDRRNLPDNLKIGDRFNFKLEKNKTRSAMILDFRDNIAIIDFNHRLASKVIEV